jgi:hypothetical protein
METKLQTDPPKKCGKFLAEQMDGEIVLLDTARNIIIHTNETAALVWQLCNGLNTIDQIVQLLGDVYPDASDQIAKDVPEIIQELREQGALDGC